MPVGLVFSKIVEGRARHEGMLNGLGAVDEDNVAGTAIVLGRQATLLKDILHGLVIRENRVGANTDVRRGNC